ncbi:MAG TPA: SCO family protein [Myxococcaceae bacterium]|nr:SCO family protein [Myxococcaceae bacterium]
MWVLKHGVLITALLSGVAAPAAVLALARLAPGAGGRADAGESPSRPETPLFTAPAFSLQDQRGRRVRPEDLRGQPYVANFIFTTCTTSCPLLTAKMMQVQRALTNVPVRFVSFSVDPVHDTPEVLAAYARRWAPGEPRWSLLTGEAAHVSQIVSGFHAVARPAGWGSGESIVHSSTFALVDADGGVRGTYEVSRQGELQALVADVRKLTATPRVVDRAGGRNGESLYHELSCVACHERPELAPPLWGRPKTPQELARLRKSILQPDDERVAGYPLHMPSYQGLISDAELDALVAWIADRPAAAADPGHTATDVVCGMSVRVDPASVHVTQEGRTQWFCSAPCRDRFLAHPAAFDP